MTDTKPHTTWQKLYSSLEEWEAEQAEARRLFHEPGEFMLLRRGVPLRPSNGEPYIFKTRKEAYNTANMCSDGPMLPGEWEIVTYENDGTN